MNRRNNMSDSKLTILNEVFQKEGSNQEIAGLTVLVDGTIKNAFDLIKDLRSYESYNEVMRDIVFAGMESILKSHKND